MSQVKDHKIFITSVNFYLSLEEINSAKQNIRVKLHEIEINLAFSRLAYTRHRKLDKQTINLVSFRVF